MLYANNDALSDSDGQQVTYDPNRSHQSLKGRGNIKSQHSKPICRYYLTKEGTLSLHQILHVLGYTNPCPPTCVAVRSLNNGRDEC